MSNYTEATGLLRDPYTNDNDILRGNGLATLALVDEMREARKPVPDLDEVHIIHAYDPETDMLIRVASVHRDREKAYEVRDAMNAKANELENTVRYIVKTVGLL